jgi:hypothetical protein
MLLALRDALDAAEGGAVRLADLARTLEADPAVVRSVLTHAVGQGWLPNVEVIGGEDACGPHRCQPVAADPVCRRCPLGS